MDRIEYKNKYELYLASEEFDKIRQEVFKRDGGKCVVCSSSEQIEPHHLHYLTLFHESISDLITLCKRCHKIYHIIDNRRKLAEELYFSKREEEQTAYEEQLEKERKERELAYKQEKENDKKISQQIIKEIQEEYLPHDYCKNGDLDMYSWQILNPIIEHKIQIYNFQGYFYKGNIRDWFLYRRCEFFKRCLDKNISLAQMKRDSKFLSSFLDKWYRRPLVEAKLKEEETLLTLQRDKEEEETNNAET